MLHREARTADHPLAWAIRGALLAPVVLLLHEGTHAVVSLAYGFGPVVIRNGGTEAARLDPFLHGLDAGVAPAVAAAAAGTSAACAIAPTGAALVVSFGTAVACWVAVRRRTAAGPTAIADRAGRRLRVLTALGTTSGFRLAPAVMLVALARGCPYCTADDPRVAAVLGSTFGHAAVWGVLVGSIGVTGWALGYGMLRRTVAPPQDWWFAGLFLIGAFEVTGLLLSLVPAIALGRG